MITMLNLTGIRAQRAAAANRKFTERHWTRSDCAVLGFAAGVAVAVIALGLCALYADHLCK